MVKAALAPTTAAPDGMIRRRTLPGGGRIGWLVGKPLFWGVILAAAFGIPLGRSVLAPAPVPPPILATLPALALTDQNGAAFGTKDLAGKTWVANFIFTTCAGPCPVLTQKMAGVVKRGRQLGNEFHAVSFTVDPERDTPETLAAYAARHGANLRRWSFVTGPMEAVQAAVVDGFKIGMGREKRGDFWDVFHGEHFVLVDRQLRIRGYYEASPEGLDKLMADVGYVVNNG